MNILHFIEKIPWLLFELEERYILIYSLLLYVVDVISILKLCKDFNEPIWIAFMPFYNWSIVFKYCWNKKAFIEHLIIELLGFGVPLIVEHLSLSSQLMSIISIIDFIIALFGLKHAIEIGMYSAKSYSYNKYLGIILSLVFDSILLLTAFGKNNYLGNFSKEH